MIINICKKIINTMAICFILYNSSFAMHQMNVTDPIEDQINHMNETDLIEYQTNYMNEIDAVLLENYKALKEILKKNPIETKKATVLLKYAIKYNTNSNGNNNKIIKILLKNGARPNINLVKKNNALHLAIIEMCDFLSIKTIIKYISEDVINNENNKNLTPLYLAIIQAIKEYKNRNEEQYNSWLEIISLLLRKGADPEIRDCYGYNAFDILILHSEIYSPIIEDINNIIEKEKL